VSGTILVTGGLGYIGSHTCVALAQAGFRLAVVDNLCNSRLAVLERIRELAGGADIEFQRADLRDYASVERIFSAHRVETVIHFAGLKAVGESVAQPLEYYDNNLGGTLSLLRAMARHGVRRIVFSSSATVYGTPLRVPIDEAHPLAPQSPYGRSKRMIEEFLGDEAAADAGFLHATLRYFNPVGAHPSGRIGEDPRGAPNNLFPYLTQVAVGRLPTLRIFGSDYATPDGTGVRDYIHIMDLAAGHLAALRFLQERRRSIVANLGTGRGYSVLEAVRSFERATGRSVPIEMADRRPGDVAECYADPSLAARELGWRATSGIEEMCRDAWRWQSENPTGYPE
jgi:UDP-glucose 4-epimerase